MATGDEGESLRDLLMRRLNVQGAQDWAHDIQAPGGLQRLGAQTATVPGPIMRPVSAAEDELFGSLVRAPEGGSVRSLQQGARAFATGAPVPQDVTPRPTPGARVQRPADAAIGPASEAAPTAPTTQTAENAPAPAPTQRDLQGPEPLGAGLMTLLRGWKPTNPEHQRMATSLLSGDPESLRGFQAAMAEGGPDAAAIQARLGESPAGATAGGAGRPGARVTYENVPDPWSRSVDPVGPGFHREPRLENNVWVPPPGGYSTEDNPRWHEGTPAWIAEQQQFVNRGQMGGTPTTRGQAMAALPGSDLQAKLQAYDAGPNDFVGRTVESPAGPSTGGIATLRGGMPGMINFYNQQQLADQRQRGINLVMPGSNFEWNAFTTDALNQALAGRAQQALQGRKLDIEAQKAGGEVMHAKAAKMQAEAQLAAFKASPEAEARRLHEHYLETNPQDIVKYPHLGQEVGRPLDPKEKLQAALKIPATEEPTLMQALLARMTLKDIQASPLRAEFLAEKKRRLQPRGWGDTALEWINPNLRQTHALAAQKAAASKGMSDEELWAQMQKEASE